MGFFDIPEELVSNILFRLSVKSLKQLSCVNKSWYSLIRSSSFVSQHYKYHSLCNVNFLVKHELPNTKQIGFSLLSEEGDVCDHWKVIGSPFKENLYLTVNGPCINGIICLLHRKNFIALWNPATGERRKLPKCRLSYPRTKTPYLEALGFGWISETNDYKVVMIIGFWSRNNTSDIFLPSQAFVYNLSTNCWKRLSNEILSTQEVLDNRIYINDTCLWISCMLHDNSVIYSFHMRDEVFGRISLPKSINQFRNAFVDLSILDDCVALMMHQIGAEMFIHTWVMVEYGVEQSWIKKFKIGPFSTITHGIGFRKNDDIFLRDEKGQVLLFNCHTQEVKNLGIKGVGKIEVLPYVESLVSMSKKKGLNSLSSCSQEDNIIVDIKNLYF